MTESDKNLINDFMYRIQQGAEIIDVAMQDMNDFVLQDLAIENTNISQNDMDVIQKHIETIHNSIEVIKQELFKSVK